MLQFRRGWKVLKPVVTLKKEQDADTNKKDCCEAEIGKTEGYKKVLRKKIGDLETAIDDAKGSINTLKAEIEALGQRKERLRIHHL